LPDDFSQKADFGNRIDMQKPGGLCVLSNPKNALQKDQAESNAKEVQLCPDYIP
jgi:hypothetical protein